MILQAGGKQEMPAIGSKSCICKAFLLQRGGHFGAVWIRLGRCKTGMNTHPLFLRSPSLPPPGMWQRDCGQLSGSRAGHGKAGGQFCRSVLPSHVRALTLPVRCLHGQLPAPLLPGAA